MLLFIGMNPNTHNEMVEQVSDVSGTKTSHPVHQITAVSKSLAVALFILLPFVGGYIGYQMAPVPVVEIPVPVPVVPVAANLPDSIITYNGVYNETNSTKYHIRSGILFYEETSLGIAPILAPIAYAEDLVWVDGHLVHGNAVLESTKTVKEIAPGVFLTDTTLYQQMMTEGGERIVTKAFTGVKADTFVPVLEFTDASSSRYVRPVADGGYVNRWFTDTNSFYCVKESQPKLTLPVTVVFHTIDLKDYAGAPTTYINRKPYPLWNQVNKKNTLGYLTFKEMNTGKEYDTSCQLMQ